MISIRVQKWSGLVATALVLILSGHALAALTVEIVTPDSDPFQVGIGSVEPYAAVAYMDGVELSNEEVEWEWDFGDGTAEVHDNPTTHSFDDAGTYTVQVVATVGELQAQDTASTLAGGQQLPFDTDLAIYVAHAGWWACYSTGLYEEAEIEDRVAVFGPGEQMSDDPEIWAAHQINSPTPLRAGSSTLRTPQNPWHCTSPFPMPGAGSGQRRYATTTAVVSSGPSRPMRRGLR